LVFICYDIRLELKQVKRGVGIFGVEKEGGGRAPMDDENDYHIIQDTTITGMGTVGLDFT